ncbi:hypothetical protein HII28_13885 [Planctomonas sp. JC2975]|uniref:hypothetical protein n=1 Tax=Planctomonas sp. JC2975 TaxID=2729626 RepID=UPI001473BFC5|nr:hypothetical protein [Planctomonas sp. JC2975]NNC12962.1 hypothetical protein [Planctomonas sp. JC2975]
MIRKIFAVAALAVLGIFAVPLAANAAGYVPSGACGVSGSPVPGGTVTITCAAGTWTDGETISITVSGDTSVTAAAFRTAVTSGPFTTVASATGADAVNLALPSNASGTYTVTSTGTESGNVDVETFTIVAPAAAVSGTTSTSGEVAATGSTIPILIIWVASGLVLLGAAIVVVRLVVRRQRINS